MRALNLLLIVHADHEQNCSTSTVRMVGSSQANLFASISAGISALWGPLHGGANEACVEMLEQIRKDGGDVQKFVDMAKDREDSVRLMGFGHRVYKNFDPRARIIKAQADKLLGKLSSNDDLRHRQAARRGRADRRLLHRAQAVPQRRLLLRRHLPRDGLPEPMFTVLFAMGRLPGWIAHWREMHDEPDGKICRPRQIYTGYTERDYKKVDSR